MKLPVNPGEKYGLIALSCHTNIQAPVDLGNGFWAAPEGSIDVAKYWQEWLGSIRTRDLREASLVLVATGATDRPGVLDGDNQALLRRVDALYWGLLTAAPLLIPGQPMRVTGSNVYGEIEIRGASNMNPTFHIGGLPLGTATEEVLLRAASLGSGVLDLLAVPEMRRMRAAVSTFMIAFWRATTPKRSTNSCARWTALRAPGTRTSSRIGAARSSRPPTSRPAASCT